MMSSKKTARRIWIAVVSVAVLGACSSGPSRLERLQDPDVLYEEGAKAMNVGSWDRAIGIFEHLEVAHPFAPATKQAQLDLAYAYYRSDKPESAIDAADTFIRENPRHANVDYAYYLRGLAYFPRDRNIIEKLFRVDLCKRPPNDSFRAFLNFQTLVQRFPESEYSVDGRDRMVYLRNCLAANEVHVARYYVNRGAYVAAVNRTKYVVNNFQGAPAVREALELQVLAYRKLELNDLATASSRVLAESFPDSKYAAAKPASAGGDKGL